jgi:hypothetical protein
MMQTHSLVDRAVERILELSAELQIRRRAVRHGSPAFHDFGVAIAAYGDVLEVLTTLQEQREYCSSLGLLGSVESSREPRALFCKQDCRLGSQRRPTAARAL